MMRWDTHMVWRVVFTFMLATGSLLSTQVVAQTNHISSPADVAATTEPMPLVFGALFPSPLENSFHNGGGHGPDLNIFDPLLTSLLRHDAGTRGQGIALNDELIARLLQSSTPSTSTASVGITDDPDFRSQLAGDPGVVVPTGSSTEVPSPYSPYLIGSGLLLLAIVGLVQLRSHLRKKMI